MRKPIVHAFFDNNTNTISYIVADPDTREAAVIDSVLDYEPNSGTVSYESANKIIDMVTKEDYRVTWILETHAHADHLTAAQYLKEKLGGRVAIGEKITVIQKTFAQALNLIDLSTDGRQFDHLWKQEEIFSVGRLSGKVIEIPGHTPADVAYLIGDALFVGDALFMPDYGTARCDFPGGNAKVLFSSLQKLYALPPETRMFLCHDYLPPSRTEYRWETTIHEQQERNIHVTRTTTEEQFVYMRTMRDAQLSMPRLIIPALQVNIRAGHLPDPEGNGVVYLKIPVNGIFRK